MITARNTNDMMYTAYDYIYAHGIRTESRNGPVLSVPYPVTLCYTNPLEKVNFCPVRNANPFFHAIEPLWFLEAHGDVAFITNFIPRMAEYSDDGVFFNANYGHRIRVHFKQDQLRTVAHHLTHNPDSRRAVVQLWSPDDLDKDSEDLPCNMTLVFRIVNHTLDMTVYNRSNDAIWGGVSGANITNLPIFQEYVAAQLSIPVGRLYIVSNNLHLYLHNPQTQQMLEQYAGNTEHSVIRLMKNPYLNINYTPIISDPKEFDEDLTKFMGGVRTGFFDEDTHANPYFQYTMLPMIQAFWAHKNGNKEKALNYAQKIKGEDWQFACTRWLTRRYTK